VFLTVKGFAAASLSGMASIWTARGTDILEKVKRARRTLNNYSTLHEQ